MLIGEDIEITADTSDEEFRVVGTDCYNGVDVLETLVDVDRNFGPRNWRRSQSTKEHPARDCENV